MANIKTSMTELIGHTPLLELARYEREEKLPARILLKMELSNPNQSAKDRIALQIIEDAKKDGRLTEGMTIVETTSGNTGIALAGIAAAKGHPFKAYIQDHVSQERYQVIRALGGETIRYSKLPEVKKVLEEENGDFVAALNALKKQLRNEDVFFADQCYNLSNSEAHRKTTGPEIWEDTDGKVDIVVASVGTGGTISGIGQYLKSRNPDIKIVAVEPGEASTPSDDNPEPEEIMGIHRFLNREEKYIPKTLDLSVIDETVDVETPEAYEEARKVARYEGFLVGASTGAAIRGAKIIANRPENEGKQIVVIAVDTGLRYLSTNLYE